MKRINIVENDNIEGLTPTNSLNEITIDSSSIEEIEQTRLLSLEEKKAIFLLSIENSIREFDRELLGHFHSTIKKDDRLMKRISRIFENRETDLFQSIRQQVDLYQMARIKEINNSNRLYQTIDAKIESWVVDTKLNKDFKEVPDLYWQSDSYIVIDQYDDFDKEYLLSEWIKEYDSSNSIQDILKEKEEEHDIRLNVDVMKCFNGSKVYLIISSEPTIETDVNTINNKIKDKNNDGPDILDQIDRGDNQCVWKRDYSRQSNCLIQYCNVNNHNHYRRPCSNDDCILFRNGESRGKCRSCQKKPLSIDENNENYYSNVKKRVVKWIKRHGYGRNITSTNIHNGTKIGLNSIAPILRELGYTKSSSYKYWRILEK